jgi:serine/threonine protein kinase/tetratricopeptide (TPR) repeat protein
MICPHCASEVEPAEGRCPDCSGAIGPDTLFRERETEIPTTDGSEDKTQFLSSEDHDETLLAGEGATVLDSPTTDEAGSQDEGDLSEDTTVLMDEDATLIAGDTAPTPPSASEDTGPLESGQNFGNRYHIIKLLGLGGMGAVYQAWDTELEIIVAVKVIRPEAASDPKMAAELDQRFKRELLLAREVTHKNVVRIHDLGEMEGIKYITMSFIEGEDLSSIVKREGKLPIPQALQITRDVVSGLVVAHEAGVVHRDMKPANIMIGKEDSNAYIMDFGIARSASDVVQQVLPESADIPAATTTTPVHGHTVAGAIVGTFEYMAPEQFRGEVADQRADLYTMGLILYDMLTGRRRSKSARSAVAEVQRRTKESPPPLREVDPEIPEPLEQLVSHCLEPDPDDRFQTTGELEAALDLIDDDGTLKPVKRTLTWKLMATAAAIVIALLAGTFWFARTRAPEEAPEPMSILVADFKNETGDASFDGALEQALTISMEGAGFISTYSRPSALETAEELLPGSGLDVEMARLISRREGIDVVLAGTLVPKGSGYRISAEALDAALESEGAKPLAKASAKARSREDVLPAVGRLASDLRKRLGDTTPESARLAASETVTASSIEALQAYTRAQDLADANKNQEALAAYQETLELDPNFGRAWAGMGVIYTIFKDEEKTKAAYDQALKLVDRMSEREKYRTLGTYYMGVARNYEKAIENYETLVELYPADNVGHGNLALAYLNTGNVQRALEEGRKALELYPGQWADRYNYAMYSMYAGDFETAEAEGARVVEQVPTFELAFVPVALSRLARDDYEGALSVYEQLAATSPYGASLASFGRADLEMYRGGFRRALEILEEAIALDEKAGSTGMLAQNYVAAAEAYLVLGENEQALAAARKAAELSSHESVLFPAALVLLRAGSVAEAEAIALDLDNRLQTLTSAYARLIEAEVAMTRGEYATAIEKFRDSIERRDTWFGRFLLGRLYVDRELYPEAMAELDLAVERHGEVTDVFFYDTPSLRYLPEAYYWLARAQQPIGVAEARENYAWFLEHRTEADSPDPLAADASQRWSSLGIAETG